MAETTIPTSLPDGSRIPAQLFAAVISSSDDAIVVKSLDGVISTWNQGAMRMYGYTLRRGDRSADDDALPPSQVGEIADILDKVRNGERISHYETTRLRKDGSIFPVSVSVSPVNDEYGNTIVRPPSPGTSPSSAGPDDCHTCRSEQGNRADQREPDEILYSSLPRPALSPPGATGYSGLLLRERADGLAEDDPGYVEENRRPAERMSTLIEDLLILSRSTRATMYLQAVDLSAEVDDIAGQLQREEPGRDVRFSHPAPGRSGQIPPSFARSCRIWWRTPGSSPLIGTTR